MIDSLIDECRANVARRLIPGLLGVVAILALAATAGCKKSTAAPAGGDDPARVERQRAKTDEAVSAMVSQQLDPLYCGSSVIVGQA